MLHSQNDPTEPAGDWEEWIEAFEDAWQNGVPAISEFIAKIPDSDLNVGGLCELVAIDIENRWRARDRGAALIDLDGLPPAPTLENYLSLISELGPQATLPVHVIVSEYRTRHLFGDKPVHQDFINRFPTHSGLEAALQQEDERLLRERPQVVVEPGSTLGPYEVIRLIGSGGMGEVYRARDPRLGREVAIKVLPADVVGNASRLSRFQREARAVASVTHPNIVVLYDIGDSSGLPYVVTELLSGESLRDKIRRGPVPLAEALAIATELADGLQAVHQAGVIHRDLKPANIVFAADGRPRILDFGLARDCHATPQNRAGPETVAGTVMGTPGYMPPEQIRGQAVDVRADIFAMGCILFEMLSGRGPFHRDTAADISAATLTADPPQFRDLGLNCPQQLESIVRRCLAREPAARPRTAAELLDALKQAGISGEPDEGRAFDSISPGSHNAAAATGPLVESMAVLPLSNATGSDDLNYLADGIAESVIHRLSRFADFRVMAWSTVTRYRNETNPEVLGERMGVAALLVGRLLSRGPRLVVRLELISTTDGSVIWSEQFARSADRAFDLESDIAGQISEKLRLRLSGVARQIAPPKKLAAYHYYLRGRLHWNRRNATDLGKAIRLFEQAIAEDPDYAVAYAGLADSYGLMVAWGQSRPREAFPVARQMAVKALELEDTLVEAHTSLGYISVVYEWDRTKAEQHYRDAIELDPNYATARHWLGYLLMLSGRFSESEDQLQAARRLDPLSPIISANWALVAFFARDFTTARQRCDEALAQDDGLPSAHYYRGLVAQQLQQDDQAIAAFERGILISGGVPGELGALGHACARSGRLQQAHETLEQLNDLRSQNHVTAWNEGLVRLGLGEYEEAFALFEEARSQRDFYLIYLDVDPRLDEIRGDNHFSELRRRAGFGEVVT